jgi:hypothetical protein
MTEDYEKLVKSLRKGESDCGEDDRLIDWWAAMGDAADAIETLNRKLSEETGKREQFEEELDCAHMFLDGLNLQRGDAGGKFSLVGRIRSALGIWRTK